MKSQGFTLIELVIVIVILGIIGTQAISKFMDVTDQAYDGRAAAATGAFRVAIRVSHATWLAEGEPSTITFDDGQTIVMSSTGWPEATSGTSDDTATAAKCLDIWNGLLKGPPIAATGTCTGTCHYLVRVTTSPVCEYVDLQGTGSNTISYDVTTGAVSGS